MKKWMLILGTTLTMVIFLLIMGTGFLLKQPLTGDDDVLKKAQKVESLAKSDGWEPAEQEWEEMIRAWEKVKNRIQYSVERDFIEDIDDELATIKGSIEAKNKDEVIIATERLKIIWNELGK